MYCAISGEIPKEPVVSKTTGLLFEKSLIEKALRMDGKCPVTGQPMSEDDLIVIQASKLSPPRTAAPVSVPGLLNALQQEWDEHVLESFQLKSQLEATRKELAYALYQHDAACRVIARLMRERDEARHMLQQFHINPAITAPSSAPSAASSGQQAMEVESEVINPAGVSEEVLSELNGVCKSLSATRKGRKAPEGLISKESMPSLSQSSTFTPHINASQKVSAVNCITLKDTIAITGGADRAIVLTDTVTGKVRCRVNGHEDEVTHVASNRDVLYSASKDRTLKTWISNSAGGYSEKFSFKHSASIAGFTVHPSGNYVVTATANSQMQFFDVSRKSLLSVISAKDAQLVFSSCAFHPDGLILGTGTSTGALKIWDIREQKNVSDLSGHTSSVLSVAFSENGYLAASGSANGEIKLWDLRKLVSTKSLEVGSAVSAISFDYSGVYLGIGCGKQIQVQVVKDWVASAALPSAHDSSITGVTWGENAANLFSCSLDGTVKVFSPK